MKPTSRIIWLLLGTGKPGPIYAKLYAGYQLAKKADEMNYIIA